MTRSLGGVSCFALLVAATFCTANAQEPQIDSLTAEIASKLPQLVLGIHDPRSIVVLDFTRPNFAVNELGIELANEVAEGVKRHTKEYVVIDRAELRRKLAEDLVSPRDFADPNDASCYGMPGTVAVVQGDIEALPTEAPDKITLAIKVSEGQAPLFEKAVTLPLTDRMRSLMETQEPVAPEKWQWVSPDHPDADNIAANSNLARYPTCLYCPTAVYSDAATTAKLQGTVSLNVVISSEGRASKISVLRGLSCGLNPQAIEAVKQWRFRPATGADGKPEAVRQIIEVTFHLY